VRLGQRRDHRHERAPDRGGEPRDPHDAGRLPGGVEIGAGGLERGEDRHGVVGEPLPGRRQPHPSSGGLDERRPRLAGQHGELVRDRRRRVAELVGDGAHRPAPRELEQQTQAPRIHRSRLSSGLSEHPAWTQTVMRPTIGP
jgi:hypothetical protein